MLFSCVPEFRDIERKLQEVANRSASPNVRSAINSATNSWLRNKPHPYQVINNRKLRNLFQAHSAAIRQPISKKDWLSVHQTANMYYVDTGVVYRNHHVLDELWHWLDDYVTMNHILDADWFDKADLEQMILFRVKSPVLGLSGITRMLVQEFRQKYGLNETKELLKQSYWKWNRIATMPLKHCNRLTINGEPAYLVTTSVAQWVIDVTTSLDEGNQLLSHNTKATDFFKFKYGKHPAYQVPLGIELELENFEASSMPALRKVFEKHAILKRDGSLRAGVEICTAPATLDIHKEVFKEFFIDPVGLAAEDSCGLHVHVDRAKLTPTQTAKIRMLVNNPDNELDIVKIAGRIPNNYCRREDMTWKDSWKPNGNRYLRVNTSNRATVEFRLFASTTKYEVFTRCLEFVQAVVDYTRTGEHDCNIKEMIDIKNMFSYVGKHHYLYPTLSKFITETV